jgi:hypothetical protein
MKHLPLVLLTLIGCTAPLAHDSYDAGADASAELDVDSISSELVVTANNSCRSDTSCCTSCSDPNFPRPVPLSAFTSTKQAAVAAYLKKNTSNLYHCPTSSGLTDRCLGSAGTYRATDCTTFSTNPNDTFQRNCTIRRVESGAAQVVFLYKEGGDRIAYFSPNGGGQIHEARIAANKFCSPVTDCGPVPVCHNEVYAKGVTCGTGGVDMGGGLCTRVVCS